MSSAAFQKFTSDAISTSQREKVIGNLWSNSTLNLNTIFKNPNQTDNDKRYYYQIFNSNTTGSGAEPQFTMAYGDVVGSGSSTGSFGYNPLDYPTKAIYSQYRNLVGLSNQSLFTFQNGETSEYIYVINIERSRFKDAIANKTWQLSLMRINGTGSAQLGEVVVTGSNKMITLIDNSEEVATELSNIPGTYYYLVSGSVANGQKVGDNTPYGIIYPDLGIIILNGKSCDASMSFSTARTSNGSGTEFGGGADNIYRFWTSVSGAMSFSPNSGSFTAQSLETIASTYYYVRLTNGLFNYSQNPTYYSGSSNELRWPSMYNDPKVYVTTIGLFDDDYNLLGTAKLNEAVPKSFDKEITIKVRLDY